MINGTGLEGSQYVAPGSMPHVKNELISTHQLTIFEVTSLVWLWLHRGNIVGLKKN